MDALTSKVHVTKDDFTIMKVIGRGSYGKVYQVTHNATGQIYAMKAMRKDLIIQTDQVAGIKVERKILEKFDHPFVMKL